MESLTPVDGEGDVVPDDEVEPTTAHVPFARLVQLFQRLSSAAGKVARLGLLSEFWAEMETLVETVSGATKRSADQNSYPSHVLPPAVSFALLRLLAPMVDRRRAAYGLKEKALADIYCDVLMLDKNSSSTYFNLKHFKVPERRPGQSRDSAGDFPNVLEENLKGHAAKKGSLSVADVNYMLAVLGSNRAIQASAGEKKILRREIFTKLANQATARENAWFARLVLKNMQVGFKEKTLFEWFHRDAHEFYKSRTDLHLLCTKTNDPNFVILERPPKIFVGQPGQLQMSQKAPQNLDLLISAVQGNRESFYFYMEPKYDGERLQLHKEGTKLTCFTRNGFSSDYLWMDVLKEPILQAFHDVYACVLDGEVVTWDEGNQKFLDPNDSRSWAVERNKQTNDHDARNSMYKVQFQIFDIIFWQLKKNQAGSGAKVVELTLENRKKVLQTFLKKKYRPKDGEEILKLPTLEKGCNSSDIMQKLDTYLERKYEGVMIKNPLAQYHMGSRDLKISAKLKPDFLEGGMSDLDLAVLAGYYSTGRKAGRAGRLSHFLLGVRKSNQPGVFIPVGRVGSGYSVQELDQIRERTAEKWFEHDTVPPYIHNPATGADNRTPSRLKNRPDRWISPQDSFVFVIRAFSLVKDPVNGYSLRFPRATQLHADKLPGEALSLEELIQLDREKDDGRVARHEKAKKRKQESETLSQKKSKKATTASDKLLFRGLEMAVFADRVKDAEESEEISELIVAHGGSVVKAGNTHPTKTHRIVRISPDAEKGRSLHLERTHTENRLCCMTMVNQFWIRDCVSRGRLEPIFPKYFIWAPKHIVGHLEQEARQNAEELGKQQSKLPLMSEKDLCERLQELETDREFLREPAVELRRRARSLSDSFRNLIFGDRCFFGLEVGSLPTYTGDDLVLKSILLTHGARFSSSATATPLGSLSIDWARSCAKTGKWTPATKPES